MIDTTNIMVTRKDGVIVRKLLGLLVVMGLVLPPCFGAAGCGKKGEKNAARGGGDRLGNDWDDGSASPEKAPSRREKGESKKTGKKTTDDGDGEEKKGGDMKSREAAAPEAVTAPRPKTAEPPEKGPRSGILTAGSFDDNLYPDPFRVFVKKLGQDNQYVGDLPGRFLGHRLVVAVTGKDGRPVGNARVTVAPVSGGNSVKLVTRSDGTAVFLSSWDQVAADEDYQVTVAGPDGSGRVKQTVPRRAERWQVSLSSAPALLPRKLDLVLVLDTTGSMSDELEYLKSEFRGIAADVDRQFPGVDKRYGLVVYRDEGMGDEYVTRTFPLTPFLIEFRNNLSAQSAAGGGDYPEAMHRGLEEAVGLEWRDGNTARVVFLVADAPPHTQFANRTMKAVDTLRKKGVVIYPVAASGTDDACEFIMRSGALLTGGKYLFLTNDSGVGDAHGEPHIPYYHVERLNKLMVRMIAGELAGKRIEPRSADILRTVGRPNNRGRK
jgi:hypothetical protein